MNKIEIIPIKISGDISVGKALDVIILQAIKENGQSLHDGDILVVAQKIVSKAEGRVVDLDNVKPSEAALQIAREQHKSPRVVEIILQESRKIIKARNGIIITETNHGLVCANSGVDQSNVRGRSLASLLPVNPDKSATSLSESIRESTGKDIGVIITDTFGRPFRMGQTNVAIGISRVEPIKNYIGTRDLYGRKLKVTEIAIADEIASAAELVMGKSDGIPVALVRGFKYTKSKKASGSALIRPKEADLFR